MTARRGEIVILSAFLTMVAAGLVAYSQTMAFAWDEGFHLLTAKLILHGKRPYVDFVFSQTPLNAYWNAGWMAIFGETWRVPHAVAALCSAGAVVLSAAFVYRRFPALAPGFPAFAPGGDWRLAGAIMAAVLTGLNSIVVRFGGIGQAYGLCLLTLTAAYWLAILSVRSRGCLAPALAGLLCGIAAASSLLSAPAGPIVLLWSLAYNCAGSRWRKGLAFVLGEIVAFIPVFWLAAEGPRQVYFGIVEYNLRYRQLDWPNATRHNLEILGSWIESGPAMVLVLLAIAGWLFVQFRGECEPWPKAELRLCAWLSLGFGIYISTVRPTFERYYIFAVPFLSVLAVAGIRVIASTIYKRDRPWSAVAVVTFLTVLGLGKVLYDERDAATWPDMEEVAAKVKQVTRGGAESGAANGQKLFADELTYFLTDPMPPNGAEMWNSHKFDFAPADLALLHLIPQRELERQVRAGVFGTLETCEDDDYIAEHGFARLYGRHADAGGCTVFWNFLRKTAGP